jgi:hypothetical protein
LQDLIAQHVVGVAGHADGGEFWPESREPIHELRTAETGEHDVGQDEPDGADAGGERIEGLFAADKFR